MNINLDTAAEYVRAFTQERNRDWVTFHNGQKFRFSNAVTHVCTLFSAPAKRVEFDELATLAKEVGTMKKAEEKLLDKALTDLGNRDLAAAEEALGMLTDEDAIEQLQAAIDDHKEAIATEAEPESTPKVAKAPKAKSAKAKPLEEFVEDAAADPKPKPRGKKDSTKLAKEPKEKSTDPRKAFNYGIAQSGDTYDTYMERLLPEDAELVQGYLTRYESRGHNLLTHTKIGLHANVSLYARANMGLAASRRWETGRDTLIAQMLASPKRAAAQDSVKAERKREAAENAKIKKAAKLAAAKEKLEAKAAKAAEKNAAKAAKPKKTKAKVEIVETE